jgi:hypothetical protein
MQNTRNFECEMYCGALIVMRSKGLGELFIQFPSALLPLGVT